METHWCIFLHTPRRWIYRANTWLFLNGMHWRKLFHRCHKGTDLETWPLGICGCMSHSRRCLSGPPRKLNFLDTGHHDTSLWKWEEKTQWYSILSFVRKLIPHPMTFKRNCSRLALMFPRGDFNICGMFTKLLGNKIILLLLSKEQNKTNACGTIIFKCVGYPTSFL